ncbi:PBECR2 nuclease fold domain-containing protein [Enterocloster clostridioformis]|uniref:phage minor capsid protein n=1 Tax=Enterocloster clostridioformis TaxID=1531 RepID=UPI00232E0096|nr:phage minor capsid protein [Enterocloster clostridioformis]MDB2135557.1 PBECR2 nuclease fold domain-containing protein [Enterocloster clostridioformis]
MPLTEYDIGAAFKAIEDELIASMIRNMDRHRAEETKEGIEWSMWQAEQLKALEKYKRDNQRFKGRFQDLNKEMGELIRISRQRGNMQQEVKILDAIRKGFPAKKISQGVTAEFFRLNDRKLEALVKATTNDMQQAETAVLRMANDQYRKAIFNAQVYANSGAGTYEKAVDMATRDMLSRGLNCVEYANGARHTLADYADMAIRTASKRAYLQGEGEKRQEWGITTVIVNKRGNPCPKCLPFVGKVLIDDVWSGGKKSDGLYPLMSQAIAAGLYHPRCKDSHTTYFPGISTADDTWTKEELDAVERANQKETKRQYAERQAEKFRRLVAYSLDKENQERYMTKREEWGAIAKDTEPDIIKPIDTEEEIQVHPVGKIDKEIYKCITEDIVTDEVIITDERIGHIKERHPNDYEKYCEYLKLIVEEPDYIVETKKPNTALILKEIKESNERQFKTVLRLTTSTDNPGFKNSIITFMKIDEKEWNRLLRNKLILYKKE